MIVDVVRDAQRDTDQSGKGERQHRRLVARAIQRPADRTEERDIDDEIAD